MSAPPVEQILEEVTTFPPNLPLVEDDRPVAKTRERKLRWAVVGMGHFAQSSILPAFLHLKEHHELVALVTGDPKKAEELRQAYNVKLVASYDDFPKLLREHEVDAAYIALPNHLHASFVETTAKAGVHVLCEKPMAVTVDECDRMMKVCREHHARLMIAYRLHLDPANQEVIARVKRGEIGDVRFFSSAFSFQLSQENVRSTSSDEGGGVLYDIGVYCINAARFIFGAEPTSVLARAGNSRDPRFSETEEQVGVILEFPDGGLATFTVSLNAGDVATYVVGGTKGVLRLDPAFSHSAPMTLTQIGEKGERTEKTFGVIDQVAAEIAYFGDCILEEREPEPSGREGSHDVMIIEAIRRSLASGLAEKLELPTLRGPHPSMLRSMPSPAKPKAMVDVEAPRR